MGPLERGACSPWAEGGVVRREGDELARGFLGSRRLSSVAVKFVLNHVRQSSAEERAGQRSQSFCLSSPCASGACHHSNGC